MQTLARRLVPGVLIGWILTGLGGYQSLLADQPREKADLGGQIVWMADDQRRPLFIPQSVLDRVALERLPLSEDERGFFARRLDRQRRPELYQMQYPGHRVPLCEQHSTPGAQGSASNATDLASLMARSEAVFAGEISSVESGIDPRRFEVAQLAFIKIEEVMACRSKLRCPNEKELVEILFRGGSVNIGGTTLCDEGTRGFYQPKEGDRILVGGHVGGEGEGLFSAERVFPLQGSEIVPQPYESLVEGRCSQTIQDLKYRMTEIRKEEGMQP